MTSADATCKHPVDGVRTAGTYRSYFNINFKLLTPAFIGILNKYSLLKMHGTNIKIILLLTYLLTPWSRVLLEKLTG